MDIEMVKARDKLEKELLDSNTTPMSIPLEFLKAITSDFSAELVLGVGGFGVVYKGVLRTGKIIAVKQLFQIRLEDKTFQNEVRSLMGIKHRNVVQFVGYCAESRWEAIEQPSGSGKIIFAEIPNRLLCFEYVSNKSLDKHISDESLGLAWNTRYEIIKGICSGLHYLHEECRIVHLDLKPENILMESTMTPKIADFGLSRIFGEQQSRIVTDNRVGTRGYMAPEYLIRGVVSKKADIFSLGVIVIEIITGCKDYPYFQQDSRSTATSLQQFTEKVLGSWRNKFVSTLTYKAMERYTQQVRECISLALKCVEPSMEKRPTMKDIIQTLIAIDQTYLQTTSMETTRKEIMYSLDVNRTERWIVTGHSDGYVDIWNYDTRKLIGSVRLRTIRDYVRLGTKRDGFTYTVCAIKFIERKQCFVAGLEDGFIHVYDYKTEVQKIAHFCAGTHEFRIDSLAVHPTQPYVLSSCYLYIKLWDWDKNWECVQTFERQPRFGIQLKFNPNMTDSFASVSSDHTVKLWSLDSLKPNYTLPGHSDRVNCLDFFTLYDRQYLITGSDDKTAKIWDMRKKTCVHTLEGFMSSVISVASHPSLPVLITGTTDGAIYLWSSTNFSLIKRIVTNCGSGITNGLACLMGPTRVVFGNYWTISMMEIQDEEEVAS